ncbi:MAG: DUF488 domain-containing protein [Spirochaetes bacterium]|nr:DUF488 domain-containing protein [Spirochaetota bacterium]HOD14721.1 DUF488 domain-containing protein [Spirochaetota bacterium]
MERTRDTIYTVGHSNRTIEELFEILKAYKIERVVDIRSVPRSMHNPQFNKDAIARSLRNRHISYRQMKDLGGFRHTLKDTINTGWRNPSFRGFADYMQTDKFDMALEKLIALLQNRTTVIMCAESVPWRCHRSLIADALTARGVLVKDIYSKTSVKVHSMTPFARITRGHVSYPEKGDTIGNISENGRKGNV